MILEVGYAVDSKPLEPGRRMIYGGCSSSFGLELDRVPHFSGFYCISWSVTQAPQ